MAEPADHRGRAVPQSRIGRLARLGGLAASVAGSSALDGVRAAAAGRSVSASDLLLTPANAGRIADELSRLRGAALKVGQLISMDAGEFVSPELADILARVRAGADPMPPRQLKRVLAQAWGDDWLRRFNRFTAKPIAAASIGQVHRGETRDGRTLAIKVQYPGVRRSIDSDIDNVARLIRATGLAPAQMDLAPLFEEAKRQLHLEADYAAEAENITRFAHAFGEDDAFALPVPDEAFSTADILAMSFVPGRSIETLSSAPQAERDRVASLLIALAFREVFEFRFVQSDPNFANYLYDEASRRVGLIDFGAARAIPKALAADYLALMRAGAARDHEALRASCLALGFIDGQTPGPLADRFLALAGAALAPLGETAEFDFADDTLPHTLREGGLSFREDRDRFPAPPIDVLYLQRKFGGLFLLARRLRARVPVGALFAPYA